MGESTFTRSGPESGGNFEFHWSGPYLEAHLLSDVGKKRTHNEDRCLICAPEDDAIAGSWGFLFAVADGMGGASAGEFASGLALSALADAYYMNAHGPLPLRLRLALEHANRCVFEEAEGNADYQGMGTTLSSLVVHGDCAYLAQVGDSRIYLAPQGKGINQLTDDHSLVAEQVRNGFISAEEARNHSLKNLITRAVGTREGIDVDLFALRLTLGDTILVCSDGLSNLVDDKAMSEAVGDPSLRGAAHFLVGRAIEAGGPDNITVVLVRVTDTPPRQRLQETPDIIKLRDESFMGRLRKLFS
jgi:PPM family protein phosphatase